jgi:hypothetical protein
MVLACKVAVLPQIDNLRCLQDPEAIPAVRVLITDASCPTLEDHNEGMEFESHYGDMRTEIQEVVLSTAFCMQFILCSCTVFLPCFPAAGACHAPLATHRSSQRQYVER